MWAFIAILVLGVISFILSGVTANSFAIIPTMFFFAGWILGIVGGIGTLVCVLNRLS